MRQPDQRVQRVGWDSGRLAVGAASLQHACMHAICLLLYGNAYLARGVSADVKPACADMHRLTSTPCGCCCCTLQLIFFPSAIGSEPDDPGYNSYPHWVRTMLGHAAANLVSGASHSPVPATVPQCLTNTKEGASSSRQCRLRQSVPHVCSWWHHSHLGDDGLAVLCGNLLAVCPGACDCQQPCW